MELDVCLYNGELHILDARINILRKKFDKFIVFTGVETHAGNPKPETQFLDVVDMFDLQDRYGVKITSIEIPAMPPGYTMHVQGNSGGSRWNHEAWERNWITSSLNGPEARKYLGKITYLHMSDVDEIPHPDMIGQHGTMLMKSMRYCWNLENPKELIYGGVGLKMNGELVPDGQKLRNNRYAETPVQGRGWHFSYMGDITKKFQQFSHGEFDRPEWYVKANQNRDELKDPITGDPLTVLDPIELPIELQEEQYAAWWHKK